MVEALRDPGTDVGRLAPWCPAILEASIACDVDPYLLAGICLRETLAGWAPGYSPKGSAAGWGDGGNGWGLTQVDRRYWRDFVSSPDASDPRAQFMFTGEMLAEDRQFFARHFPDAPEAVHIEAAICAYNAGRGRVFHCLDEGREPNSVTTGNNYAHDVLRRAADLRASHPYLFAPRPLEVA